MTLSSVDCARFMVHDWGTIFEFFPLVLVRYLCRASMLYTFLSPRLKSLNFNVAILSWSVRTARIPFGRYAMTNSYSKSLGTLSQFITVLRGGR
jgi:hypothetical protein